MCFLKTPSLAAALLGTALAGTMAWACGGWFASGSLSSPDEMLLRAPSASLQSKVEELLPRTPPTFKAMPAVDGLPAQTADADLAELAEALKSEGRPAGDQAAALAWYTAVRRAILRFAESVEQWRHDERYRPGETSKPVAPQFAAPTGVPSEFSEYLRGAAAWHEGDPNLARQTWEQLLARPASERPCRSTWAAFMLGRYWHDRDPGKAAEAYRRVRGLAADGFKDSLGLAASSLGWEGQLELRRGHYEEAIRLYLEQMAADDPGALASLQRVVSAALRSDPAAQRRVAGNPQSRSLITAFLLARGGYFDEPGAAEARGWLAAVEAASGHDIQGADELGWAAYQYGDFEASRRWLSRAPADAPLALWGRAKLALHDGKIPDAMACLDKAIRAFPKNDEWTEARSAWLGPFCTERGGVPILRIRRELGTLRLGRGQYVESLDLLLRAGELDDAAYVAERVLTAEELQSYVRSGWPDVEPPVSDPGRGRCRSDWDLSKDQAASWIRHLLARRLARLGRFDEARPFYPQAFRARLDAYAAALRVGKDRRRPAAERAAVWWEAAGMARHEGIDLLGTDVEPDWRLYGGTFRWLSVAEDRARPNRILLAPMSVDELHRTARSETRPQRPLHYRWIAAEHAWEAALLMPDGTDELAERLCTAGLWIADRDPEGADRFYKALVNRCRNTKLGAEADRRRWFPKLQEK